MKCPRLSRRAPLGFSLIEVMTGMVIAGITLAAATSVTVGINKSLTRMKKQALADEEAKVLVDYAVGQIRTSGGGSIRPWMAVSGRCETGGSNIAGCNLDTAQPLRMLQLHDSASQCSIETYDTTAGTLTFPSTGGTCCTDAWATDAPPSGTTYQIVVVPQTIGGGWHYRNCTLDTSGCGCSTVATIASGALDLPPESTVSSVTWPSGVVAIGKPVVMRIDPTTYTLYEETDQNGDNTLESEVLSDNTYAMGLQFMYDASPIDGVLETNNQGLILASATTLRMVKVSFVIGRQVTEVTSPAITLFGSGQLAAQPNTFYRRVTGGAVLRNLLYFF